MKTLILIRHAKSSWDNPVLRDHDRPLNDRGRRDLPLMATLAAQEMGAPDLCISSTALRAKTTAKAFADAWGLSSTQFQLSSQLYHASEAAFMGVLRGLTDNLSVVALAGHNPGLTDLINLLQRDVELDNLPTCGVFMITFPCSSWAAFTPGSGKKAAFFYPKMLARD